MPLNLPSRKRRRLEIPVINGSSCYVLFGPVLRQSSGCLRVGEWRGRLRTVFFKLSWPIAPYDFVMWYVIRNYVLFSDGVKP